MSGKRAVAVFTENRPFAKNIRDLMSENKENQKELAEKLGVKQQTISYYRNGQSLPDAGNLIKIAQHYGVTTDYLLGLTDVKTADTSVKAICNYTGLTEEAVNQIRKFNLMKEYLTFLMPTLNGFLSSYRLQALLLAISCTVAAENDAESAIPIQSSNDEAGVDKYNKYSQTQELLKELFGRNYEIICGAEMAEYYKFTMKEEFFEVYKDIKRILEGGN